MFFGAFLHPAVVHQVAGLTAAEARSCSDRIEIFAKRGPDSLALPVDLEQVLLGLQAVQHVQHLLRMLMVCRGPNIGLDLQPDLDQVHHGVPELLGEPPLPHQAAKRGSGRNQGSRALRLALHESYAVCSAWFNERQDVRWEAVLLQDMEHPRQRTHVGRSPVATKCHDSDLAARCQGNHLSQVVELDGALASHALQHPVRRLLLQPQASSQHGLSLNHLAGAICCDLEGRDHATLHHHLDCNSSMPLPLPLQLLLRDRLDSLGRLVPLPRKHQEACTCKGANRIRLSITHTEDLVQEVLLLLKGNMCDEISRTCLDDPRRALAPECRDHSNSDHQSSTSLVHDDGLGLEAEGSRNTRELQSNAAHDRLRPLLRHSGRDKLALHDLQFLHRPG